MAELELERIETAIYEAAVIPEKWSSVLDELSGRINAVGGVFFGVTSVSSSWISSHDLHPHMEEFVSSGWALRNTRMQIGLQRGLHMLPRFVTETDYYLNGEIEKEAIYTDFFYPRGLGHSAGTIAVVPHSDMICISFERGLDRGAFSPEELQRLQDVRPHLMRASLVTARLGERQIQTAVETLTALGLPAAAVSRQGKVIEANAQFGAANHIWTTSGFDRLVLLDPAADMMLREGLDAMALSQVKRSVPIRSEPGGPLVAVIQIVPLRRLALDVFGNTAAMLVLSEPNSEGNDASLLLSLFDLTPAELDVAKAIASGQTVTSIATARGRSAATIRNQLRSVMDKTGCSRQADLIILLRSFGGAS